MRLNKVNKVNKVLEPPGSLSIDFTLEKKNSYD